MITQAAIKVFQLTSKIFIGSGRRNQMAQAEWAELCRANAYKEWGFGKSFSGFRSQLFLASKVKSVSARIFRRKGLSWCIHGMPGDLSTSMTTSLISLP